MCTADLTSPQTSGAPRCALGLVKSQAALLSCWNQWQGWIGASFIFSSPQGAGKDKAQLWESTDASTGKMGLAPQVLISQDAHSPGCTIVLLNALSEQLAGCRLCGDKSVRHPWSPQVTGGFFRNSSGWRELKHPA